MKKTIRAIIYGQRSKTFLSQCMVLLSYLYMGIILCRLFLYRIGLLSTKKLNCQVCSIGNITAGGTGKTPMTIYIASYLRKIGYRIVVISRGYGGKNPQEVGIVHDGKNILMDAVTAGDEPYLMARSLQNIPILIGSCRYKVGLKAIELFSPDIIVLDDAFQHIQLSRDINILLLDANQPFGNGYLLPRGPLREPLSQIWRADIIVMTRSNENALSAKSKDMRTWLSGRVIYRSNHIFQSVISQNAKGQWQEDNIQVLQNKKIGAFAGIANNSHLRQLLMNNNIPIQWFREFPDHHPYSDEDIKQLSMTADQLGLECLVTTEKDFVKVAHYSKFVTKLYAIKISISFENTTSLFHNCIETKLQRQLKFIPKT